MIVLTAALLALALGVAAGYALAWARGPIRSQRATEKSPDNLDTRPRIETLQQLEPDTSDLRQRVEVWRQNETVAGAFGFLNFPVDGVEQCYFDSVDLDQVTWVSKQMPAPFVGYAPAPGRFKSCVINNMHFRYDSDLSIPKPRNTYRLFLVGASTVYGAGASSNKTIIGSYLEKYLNEPIMAGFDRCEVITTAGCAWASTHERIIIENRVAELEPDMVVVFSGHNDALWAALDRNVLWFRAFYDDFLLSLQNTALTAVGEEQFNSRDPGRDLPVPPQLAGRRLAYNVSLAGHALSAVGARYIYVLQPVLHFSHKTLTRREARMAQRGKELYGKMAGYFAEFQRVLPSLDSKIVRYIDGTSMFDNHGGEAEVFLEACHFGDRGCKMVAEFLADQLLSTLDETNAVLAGTRA